MSSGGSHSRLSQRFMTAALVLAISLTSGPVWAHVAFSGLEPNERFLAGTVAQLNWVDAITHPTTSYRLEFLPGPNAAAVSIAADIPPTQHTWAWQVPSQPCSACSLHVVQVNSDGDYDSTWPIVIVADAAELTADAGPADAGNGTEPMLGGSGGTAGAAVSTTPSSAGTGGAVASSTAESDGSAGAGCSFAAPRWVSTRDALPYAGLLAFAAFCLRRSRKSSGSSAASDSR